MGPRGEKWGRAQTIAPLVGTGVLGWQLEGISNLHSSDSRILSGMVVLGWQLEVISNLPSSVFPRLSTVRMDCQLDSMMSHCAPSNRGDGAGAGWILAKTALRVTELWHSCPGRGGSPSTEVFRTVATWN